MASDSMQTHLLRLQEIMAKSAAPPSPKPTIPVVTQQLMRPQHKVMESPPITEWRPALKHVTRLVAQNPSIEESIREMISEHKQHEKQWWAERQKTTSTAELKQYDAKVYRAQKSMSEYMSKQLHAIGIPFFAPTMTEIERRKLLDLQKKMLEHLETAYGPD